MVDITRPDDLRLQNRRRLLETLRRVGSMSRTRLAGLSGLSAATVSTITSTLLAENILCAFETGELSSPGKRGRPRIALSFNPEIATVGVVEIAVNAVTAALIDYRGAFIGEVELSLDTSNCSARQMVLAVIKLLEKLTRVHERAGNRLKFISIAVQGVTDAAGQAMIWSPITPDTPIFFGAEIGEAFDVPVSVSNDCSMIAEALRWKFPERFGNDFVTVLLSHGIGMGLFHRGRLFTGIRSSAAEFGHMTHIPGGDLCRCGHRGCIEAYAGDYAIMRKASGKEPDAVPRAGITTSDMIALAQKARSSDGCERAAFVSAGHAIGYGLGTLFALTDPVPVAFVGSGGLAFDLLEPSIRNAINQTAIGYDAKDIAMECHVSEQPFIRHGSLTTALVYLDEHGFATGCPERKRRTKNG